MVAFPNSSVPFSVTDHDLKHLSPTVFKKVIHHFSLLISVCHVVVVVRGSEAPLWSRTENQTLRENPKEIVASGIFG